MYYNSPLKERRGGDLKEISTDIDEWELVYYNSSLKGRAGKEIPIVISELGNSHIHEQPRTTLS